MIPQSDTEAWFAARLGKVTASRIADATARIKNGWGASRANYMAELIAERLTSTPAESYTNAAMQWGIDHEAEARAAYEFYTDATVGLGGFIAHPKIPDAGASPDGFIESAGLLEIKCPNTATHIDTLLALSLPEKYLKQMQFQMACSGAMWCDFVSYDPRMPESMRLFVRRVERNAGLIASLEQDVREFLTEMDERIAALQKHYGAREAA
jgi:putative phage-type endonuclease